MLVLKGRGIRFDLKDGGSVSAGPSLGMFHDPQGTQWARCSLLIAPYERGGVMPADKVPGYARAYLGRTHEARRIFLDTPDKGLGGWTNEGELKEIWYTRSGKKLPFRFRHPFGKKTVFSIFRGRDVATLYAKGRYYRVQLGRSCLLDDRGIVHP